MKNARKGQLEVYFLPNASKITTTKFSNISQLAVLDK